MLLTRAAWEALQEADTIYTPAADHPALSEFRERVTTVSLDFHNSPDQATITNHAHALGRAWCAFPGTPGDWTTKIDGLKGSGFELHMIPGVSLIDTFVQALSTVAEALFDYSGGRQICTIEELKNNFSSEGASRGVLKVASWVETQGLGNYTSPWLPYPLLPARPVLVWDFAGPVSTEEPSETSYLEQILCLRYPEDHQIHLVQLNTMGDAERVWAVPLAALHTQEQVLNRRTAIFVPALRVSKTHRSLDKLHWVAASLLGPDGCPWDVQQTHQSLRGNLLEEVYEVLDALDRGDMADLAEELGDLLFQVIAHSEMARQGGHFDLGDVFEHISTKLIRRHPHVFGNLDVDDPGTVLSNWEQIKAQELREKGRERQSSLDGIPASLPALAVAQKMGSKAARAGFDWPTLERIWEKLHEELEELSQAHRSSTCAPSAETQSQLAEELGDVLYAVAQLARWLHVDAESMLRESNAKFRRRFTYVEQAAGAQGRSIGDMTLDEKVALWQEAKTAVDG